MYGDFKIHLVEVIGSNPTLSAMFSQRLSCDPWRDPLSAWQSQTHDLAVCL
jgi:hypothetical protein